MHTKMPLTNNDIQRGRCISKEVIEYLKLSNRSRCHQAPRGNMIDFRCDELIGRKKSVKRIKTKYNIYLEYTYKRSNKFLTVIDPLLS